MKPDSTPQISQQEFEQRVMFCEDADASIHQTIYDDFDNNGEMEAFVLTKSKCSKKTSYFCLWHIAPGTIKELPSARTYNDQISIEIINGTDYKHVLYSFVEADNNYKYTRTIIYKVDHRKPCAVFKHNTFGAAVENNTVKVTVKNFVELKKISMVKQWLNAPTVEREIRFDTKLNEYVDSNVDADANVDFDYNKHDKTIKNLVEVFFSWKPKYTFIDINKDGKDELVTRNPCYNIYTLKNGKISSILYLEDLNIYPEDGIIVDGGLGYGYLYTSYIKIVGNKTKMIAHKSINVNIDPNVVNYEINGKKATKSQYEAFTNTMKNKKALNWRDFDWKKPA